MQLGGTLRSSNGEELRAARMQALGGKETAASSRAQQSVGEDQQGHEITVVDSSSSRKVTTPPSEISSAHNVIVTQVSTTPEQVIQDLTQSTEETAQLARVLEDFLEIAPTMACLRALNIGGISAESVKLFEANQGTDIGDNKLILNDGHPPIRVAILVPGKTDEWTSIVPSIIPAGIKTRVPDGRGKWVEMQSPAREPTRGEQQQVRKLIQKALGSYYGSSTAEEKLFEYKEAIKVNDVAAIVTDIDEKSLASTMQTDHELLQEAQQQLSSPYIPLLEGLGAAAEFVARSAATITTTAVETAKGGLEGAVYGGIVGAIAGIAPTMVMGSAATAALSASTASTVGSIGGAGGGMMTSYLRTGAPSKIGDNTSVDYVIPGAILGSAVGGAGAVIAAHAGVPAVTAATGAIAGGVIGAINKFPSAVEDSMKYFSPQRAWTNSIQAFSRWSDGGSRVVTLIKKANETDEKMKTDLEHFFKPFEQDPKHQKIKEVLIHQIDQRMTDRTAVMQQLNRKIEEQNKSAIPTSGPIGTKRSARVRL